MEHLGTIALVVLFGVPLVLLLWGMVVLMTIAAMNDEDLARLIAHFHGAHMVMRRDGVTETVASLRGYGHWGHSTERFAAAHWREYLYAAKAVRQALVPVPWWKKTWLHLWGKNQ